MAPVSVEFGGKHLGGKRKLKVVRDLVGGYNFGGDGDVEDRPVIDEKGGVVMPVPKPNSERERLRPKRPTLNELLLSDDYYRGEMDIPPRGQHKHRPSPDFLDDDGLDAHGEADPAK